MKAALILLAVMLLGAGLFIVDRSLSQQALAVAIDGKYQVAAEGWAIVKAAWPLALLSFLLVLAVTVPVLYQMAGGSPRHQQPDFGTMKMEYLPKFCMVKAGFFQ